jgi:putative flavoprotein involved in K+ transport
MHEQLRMVLIGDGQAGLGMNYLLTRLGREHLVLEWRRLAERWHSERSDPLTLLIRGPARTPHT